MNSLYPSRIPWMLVSEPRHCRPTAGRFVAVERGAGRPCAARVWRRTCCCEAQRCSRRFDQCLHVAEPVGADTRSCVQESTPCRMAARGCAPPAQLAHARPRRYMPALGRSVAQPGRALCSGRRGRRFESSHSDQSFQTLSQKTRKAGKGRARADFLLASTRLGLIQARRERRARYHCLVV
jgi:hypothetical protein